MSGALKFVAAAPAVFQWDAEGRLVYVHPTLVKGVPGIELIAASVKGLADKIMQLQVDYRALRDELARLRAETHG